jgi:chemosensory pili system protein ChpA (sensor histidine kinase/response regulator)
LQKVFLRLQKLTHGTARFALWDICLALHEALEMDALEISVAVKNLLRQLDKEIKLLAVHGVKALTSFTHDELIKNLLYYVARAGKHAPGFSPESHLQRVYDNYQLEQALLEGKEAGNQQANHNIIAAPDAAAMNSVVTVVQVDPPQMSEDFMWRRINRPYVSALCLLNGGEHRTCNIESLDPIA